MTFSSQRGSIFAYILIAIALMGLLIITLSGGPQKSAETGQLDELTDGIQSDLKTIVSMINDCAINYPAPVDRNGDGLICSDSTVASPDPCHAVAVIDNPNPPFPLYNNALDATAYGATAVNINTIICPGAPGAVKPSIFSSTTAQKLTKLDVLSTTSTYIVKYLNDVNEGVLISVTPRGTPSALWPEVMARLNSRYSPCQANTAAGGNGTFYLWILRHSFTVSPPPTSSSTYGGSSAETGCP